MKHKSLALTTASVVVDIGSDIYAQGYVYARGVKPNKSHAYRGGPQTVVPHY